MLLMLRRGGRKGVPLEDGATSKLWIKIDLRTDCQNREPCSEAHNSQAKLDFQATLQE